MKSSINKLNNGYIGLNYLNQYDSGRITPTKYYNDVMDGYELGDEYQNTYTPPTQWVELPGFTAGEQKFAGVFAIYNDTNFVALLAQTSTGNYLVDWGDGTTGSFASNVQANKKYEPSVYAGLTSQVFRDYKTLVITVTPITGNLTSIQLNRTFSPQTNLNGNHSRGWLNCKVQGSQISSINWGGFPSNKLEQIEFVGTNQITSMSGHFSDLRSLRKIVQYYTGKATSIGLCFNNTTSLTTIPPFDLSSITNISQMFYGAFGLRYVPWMNTSNITNMVQMFFGCYSLRTIPPFDTRNVTNMSGMFTACGALKSIPKLNTSKVTSFSQTFQGCSSLKTIPSLDYSSCTTTALMFYDGQLNEFPPAEFPVCTSFDRMFYRVEALTKVGKLNCSAGINFNEMFLGCPSLCSVDLTSTENGEIFSFMFDQCLSLKTIKGISCGNGKTFRNMFSTNQTLDSLENITLPAIVRSDLESNGLNSMFGAVYSLSTVGTMDVSGLTGATFANVYSNMFSTVSAQGSVKSIGLTGIQQNFSIANQLFGPTALNNLYTSLAVVGASGSGAKTITVTGNWGATAALGHNPAIAVAKGWAVTN